MPIIILKPIELVYWRDGKVHAFWLHEDVADSFRDGIDGWIKSGGVFRVTETLRTLAVQARLKKAKPGLAVGPGWSLHGHGRAVDFDVNSVGKSNLLRFYEHMQRYGWFTIFNFPGVQTVYKSREAWHLQKTDPPGIRSREYLKRWAAGNGGQAELMNIKYEKIARRRDRA